MLIDMALLSAFVAAAAPSLSEDLLVATQLRLVERGQASSTRLNAASESHDARQGGVLKGSGSDISSRSRCST